MCRRHEARKIDFCELPLDKFACLQAFSHGRLDGRGFSEERAVGGGEKTKGAGAASEKSRPSRILVGGEALLGNMPMNSRILDAGAQ